MARRRRIPIYRTKGYITHTGTNVDNTGSSSTVESLEFLETSGGPRSSTGQIKTLTADRNNDNKCNIGDTVKYVNLFLECAGRVDIEADRDRIGWLEYAVVLKREADPEIGNTNIGTQTLGVIANRMYENECIWTGNFPIGIAQPNSISLQIKIPKAHQKIQTGAEWVLFFYFRSSSTTSTSTTAVRVISSFIYKAYT